MADESREPDSENPTTGEEAAVKPPDEDSGGAVSAAGGEEGQGHPGDLKGEGDHGNQNNQAGPSGGVGRCGQRVASASVCHAAQVLQAPVAQGPGGDAVAEAENRPLEFTLNVPFRSHLEAEMAQRALVPVVQGYQGLMHEELTVRGSILAVWTAEDPVLFRISTNSFLDQLSIVMRNIQRFRRPPPLNFNRGKKG